MVHLRKVPYLLLIKPPDLLRRYFLQFLLERLLRIHQYRHCFSCTWYSILSLQLKAVNQQSVIFVDGVEKVLCQSVFELGSEDETMHCCQVISFENLIDFMNFLQQFLLDVWLLLSIGDERQSFTGSATVASFHNKNKIVQNNSFEKAAHLDTLVDTIKDASVWLFDQYNSFIMSYSKGSKVARRTHKIILLGDSGVGKTCIIQKFATNRFDQYFNPTIGIDFVSKDIKFKGTPCRLQLWDTAGQQKFKSLVPTYLKDAVCCIFVFDLTKPETLRNMEDWVNLFRENKKERAISIICGNKNDLEKNLEKERLQQLIDKYQMPYFCVSAKTGGNLEGMFYKITQMLDKQESDKQKKLKQTFQQQYEHPPTTMESLTRSQTKQMHLNKQEDDKEKLPLRGGVQNTKRCSC